MRILILLLLLSTTSCMTKKRAIRLLDKIQVEYPELLTFDTTLTDTVYCDTIISFDVPCDTIITMKVGDTIRINNIVYVRDSIRTTAIVTVEAPPKIIKRTIKQTIKPACPKYKKKDIDIFLKWSGIAFWLSLLFLIILKWQPSMK